MFVFKTRQETASTKIYTYTYSVLFEVKSQAIILLFIIQRTSEKAPLVAGAGEMFY